jgi:hypothetical protein
MNIDHCIKSFVYGWNEYIKTTKIRGVPNLPKSLEGTHLPFIGKLKLGQQRISEDQRGVVEGLQSVNSHKAKALVHYMLREGVGIGS